MIANLVSVIIPTYKRSDFLSRCIDSVLNQTYPNIEIIVVDDNGIGDSFQLQNEEVLKSYISSKKITYLKHDVNRNGSAARNTGYKASKGDFINFLDDDDYFCPRKIEEQVNALKNTPSKIGACYCNSYFDNSKGKRVLVSSDKSGNLIQEVLMKEIAFNTSAVMFKRECIKALGGFDETFFRHQDFELYVRFFRDYVIVPTIKEPLLIKYSTPNVISRHPELIRSFKEKFLNTFRNDIDKMERSIEIWSFQYSDTACILLANKNRRDGIEFLRKSIDYKSPSFKNALRYLYWIIKSYK